MKPSDIPDLPPTKISRRELLARALAGAVVGAGGALLTGCVTTRPPRACPTPAARPWRWQPAERPLVEAAREDFDVVLHDRGALRAVLRRRARAVPAGLDLDRAARRLEHTMRAAKGVGIAGPQVGLSLRVATLLLDYRTAHPRVLFVRNPVIIERSSETIEGYEGCLSVPGVGGLVRRNRWVRIQHDGGDGAPLLTEAEGANAVLWQHELDHLDGILYLDRLLGELLPMDEVRRRRNQQQPAPPPPASAPTRGALSLRTDDEPTLRL